MKVEKNFWERKNMTDFKFAKYLVIIEMIFFLMSKSEWQNAGWCLQSDTSIQLKLAKYCTTPQHSLQIFKVHTTVELAIYPSKVLKNQCLIRWLLENLWCLCCSRFLTRCIYNTVIHSIIHRRVLQKARWIIFPQDTPNSKSLWAHPFTSIKESKCTQMSRFL